MQKTDDTIRAKSAQRKVRGSTTLNRKYVKHPNVVKNSALSIEKNPNIQHFRFDSLESVPVHVRTAKEDATEVVQKHPIQTIAAEKMRVLQEQRAMSTQNNEKITAKEMKDRAIQQALANAALNQSNSDSEIRNRHKGRLHFSFSRIMLALACTSVVVMAIVYFVNLNMPDLSLRVAAMQTGISASYPGYVPRGYTISSITSESKKVVLEFKNHAENNTYTLTEETSSWDSNALLNNYVKTEFKDNYKTVKEQGLTIYISGSNAAWMNGGVMYKISASNGVLSNKQICSIATSL